MEAVISTTNRNLNMAIPLAVTDNVESAIRLARLELGEEAMLVDSRRLPPARPVEAL